ncbi:MAG: hypothetical protein IJX39_05355, partial [Clostridia bacterium]|nr:hypothetical protein [Clostridia bacterium]
MSPCGDALGGFVITETSPEGGAYFDPNTRVVTIGADTLKSGNTWQEGLDQSALNGSKVGEIVEGVAQGVGQMLPAVAVSFIPGVGQAASLGTIMASAAGTGTEEAFGEGASYGKGLAYGAASGAVEGATEKLTGGMGKLFGGGVLDNVLGDVAKVGVKRVAKEAVGEGVEEMIS